MATAIKLTNAAQFTGKNDFTGGTWKTVLTNAAVSVAHANISDLTEVANGNGYTTGGLSAQALTVDSTGHVLPASQVTITPTGGGFSYRSIYLARVSDGALFPVAWDKGASFAVSVPDTITFSLSSGILIIA